VTDVYRTAAMLCPACSSPLREYQHRYCCDACEGILIELADFELACLDMTTEAKVEIFDRAPSKAEHPPICPICTQPMGTCRVKVGTKWIDGDITTCERHGLWFDEGVMAGVFALVSRAIIGHVAGTKGGGHHTRRLFQERASGDASEGLSIAAWRSRPRKRSPTLTPVNAYRDQKLPCPRCTGRELSFLADRYGCDACHGVFVENAALEALVADMTSKPWQMPAPVGTPGGRACPICASALGVETLEGASIDRCEAHGVWFDPDELESVLQHAASPPTGVIGWLRRLF
jgi:Zn-finger nucleic acid-binding protein